MRLDSQWVRARVAQTRGLNFTYNRTLKIIFKGAATTVIAHAGPNPFRAAYEWRYAQGTKPNPGQGDGGPQDRGDDPGDLDSRQ